MFDIVMSLYNKEEFARATIDAVLGQRFSKWRLYVVDDGSTDAGAAVVRSYGDPRITLIQQVNQGVGPARNAGIKAGSAEWIAFLDADDVWNADHLDELAAVIRHFPDATLVGSGFVRFSGRIHPRSTSGGKPDRRLARYFAEAARGRELFFTSSAAVRRSAIEEIGAFEPLPGNEDVELWSRLAVHGSVAVSTRQTVNYRVDTGGITDMGMRGRKASAKPLRREDMSSTIPTLTRLLPGITDPELRKDIADYMDSRVGLLLVAAVLEGDLAYALHVRSLYAGKPRGKARVAAMIATLPTFAARSIVTVATRSKRAVRQLLR